MLHSTFHWQARASVQLWAIVVDYTIWIFNQLPQMDAIVCPNKIWSQTCVAQEDFHRAHAFRCPVYILHPKLQDGKNIPRWDSWARLGMFVGFLTVHSPLISLVLTLCTRKISPQYHVNFFNKFETVHALPSADSLEKKWWKLCKLRHEHYLNEDCANKVAERLPIFPTLTLDGLTLMGCWNMIN